MITQIQEFAKQYDFYWNNHLALFVSGRSMSQISVTCIFSKHSLLELQENVSLSTSKPFFRIVFPKNIGKKKNIRTKFLKLFLYHISNVFF